ncbi:MAG TPA: DMT family transporter [Burkholderiales bacterium]
MSPTLAYPALALTALFWAGNALLGRALHEMAAPAVMMFWRWVAVLAVLAPFVMPELKRRAADLKRAWPSMLLLGFLSTGIYNALIYEALRYTTATNTGLLNSSIPVWTVAAGWLIYREGVTRMQALALAVSFIGVLVIVTHGDFSSLAQLRVNHGDALVLLAMMMWGVYSVCLRQRPAGISPFAYLWVTGAIGLVLLTPWTIASVAGGADWWLPAPAWAGIAYLVIFHSICATALFNRSVDILGAARASQVVHLVPVFATLLATMLLAEPLHAFHFAGFVLILAGLALAAFFTRHHPANGAQPVR